MLLATALFSLSSSPFAARAAERLFSLQGEVTSVADELNWFNNSIQVGMPVEGTYNFFDSGYLLETYVGDPSELTYRYFFAPDINYNIPVLPVNMHLAVGGNAYETSGSGGGTYAISIFNDSGGFVIGDAYKLQSPLPFPAHFTDWTGDPVKDPDGFFYPYLFMTLDLLDPTGTALTSTDLPLDPPGLAGFASAVGHIYIADGNGEPNYAMAEFRITSFQAVPEPTAFVASGVAFIAFGSLRRRPHAKK